MEKRKLCFEIVPDGCWKSNLRNILSKKAWGFIRKDVIDSANSKCVFCGENKNLHAHEIWSYDEKNGVQKLEDVVCVCAKCHEAIHINRSYLLGFGVRAEDQYMRVNGVSYAEMKQDLKQANIVNEKRNLVSEWKLDVSWVKKYVKEDKDDN